MGWIQLLVIAVVFLVGVLSGMLIGAVLLSIRADQEGAAGWNAQEGIYAFLAHLTTRPGQIPIGASAEVYPFMEALRSFVTRHSLPEPREGWDEYILPSPGDYPVPLSRFNPPDNQTVIE